MSKHTPGPWDIGYAQGDDIVIVGLERMVEICTVWSDPDACDARLIAAAPDLLAIAQRVSEWERKYPAHRIYSEGETRSIAAKMTAIVKDAEAAIAKATGETNE